MPSSKKAILTQHAPAPIGPYSQAIRHGQMLFCSGQVPIDPVTGQIREGATVEEYTRQVLENLGAVLKEAGANFDQIVKTTIFLKSMGDFPRVNEVYGSYFKGTPPARSTIEVARLPKDAIVEIEAIAVID